MSNDGRVKHPLYTTWLTMKDRCNNPRNRHFHNYGGRGIKVCDRWSKNGGSGFWAFVEDMGARPDGYTLDEAIAARDILIEQMTNEGARG